MFPRVKKVEKDRIQINEDIVTDNFFLHPNGYEIVEKSPSVTKKELDKMLLHEPSILVFGTGFKGRGRVSQQVLDAAAKQQLEVHVMNTPDALKKFQDHARRGQKVVAHIHVGE